MIPWIVGWGWGRNYGRELGMGKNPREWDMDGKNSWSGGWGRFIWLCHSLQLALSTGWNQSNTKVCQFCCCCFYHCPFCVTNWQILHAHNRLGLAHLRCASGTLWRLLKLDCFAFWWAPNSVVFSFMKTCRGHFHAYRMLYLSVILLVDQVWWCSISVFVRHFVSVSHYVNNTHWVTDAR